MWKIVFAAILVLTLFNPGHAAIVEGLYESEVVVANQGRQARKSAMSTALAEVFAKVSGRPDAINEPGLAQAIASPDLYVQQYRYKKLRANSNTERSRQVLVWFQFDEKAINSVLRQNAIPVWGKTRPATLVWLAVEEGNGRYLIGGESLIDLQNMLETEARRFGVKLIIPLLDLEDQMKLKFADVWGNFQDAIADASQRYQADAILVGRAEISRDNDWDVKWVLYENGQATNWGIRSNVTEEAMSSGIIGTLEILSARFNAMFATGGEGSVRVTIFDVKSLRGFARVSRYLNSLEQVTALRPAAINADQVSFDLDIRGSSQGLAQTIALGNTLRKMTSIPSNSGAENVKHDLTSQMTISENTYRLLP